MDGSQAVQEHTACVPTPARRVVVQVFHDGPESASTAAERMTFYAARLAGVFGDRLLLDVSGLGEHMFQRADGRWSSGPSVLLGAQLLDFSIIDDVLGRGDSYVLEWVPGTQAPEVDVAYKSAGVLKRQGGNLVGGAIGRR